jgi:hypothetical protein
MGTRRAERLRELGQSVWLDIIRRGQLISGEFERAVRDGVVGVTSNPTIFQLAISESNDYDAAIQQGIAAGLDGAELFESLAVEDIRLACDRLRPTFEQTGGLDGRVSLEVNPHLSQDTAGTVAEALRLAGARRARQPAGQDSRHRRGNSGDRRRARRGNLHQHHAHLLARPLRAGDGSLSHRSRAARGGGRRFAAHPLRGFVLRFPRGYQGGCRHRASAGARHRSGS